MSDLVDFQDLEFLDGHDLRAVFDQVSEDLVLDALVGVSPGMRHLLLTRLSTASASALEERLGTYESVSFDTVHTAQRAVVDVLCRLSRAGQVAFDDPEDMVA